MDKKAKNMSIAADPEMQSLLKVSAKKLGCSVSELIRTLVTKHLNLIINEDEKIPIILRIPSELKGDVEGVKAWMDARVAQIVKAVGEAK